MSLPTISDNTPTVLKLPPEIFPLVASHLPLQLRPTTLSAFARTSRDVYSYVRPVLYRKVIIKNVGHVLDLLERISDIGTLVWELHIRLDLRAEIQLVRNTRESVFVKLQDAVEKGHLPQLKYLRLVVLKSTDLEDDLVAQYCLPRRFWESLRRDCPLLQGMCLDGVGDSVADPWIEDPMFYDMKDFLGLRKLDFKFDDGFPTMECSKRLFQNINSLSSSLQSLTLLLNGPTWESATLVFSITLPNLISFDISGITSDETTTTEGIMNFWARHPRLERVSIVMEDRFRCFSDGVEEGLLPALSHLKARFKDVRAMESHLGQLEHLSISHSYNFQFPYLLRSVLPGGLPHLKSLEVNSRPTDDKSVLSQEEGVAWYETEDGQFRKEKINKNIWKVMDITFINSIVRGAPNLEELCLHCGVPILTSNFVFTDVCLVLGRLKSLERFFFRAFGGNRYNIEQTDLDDFLLRCRMLGNSCESLRTVTNVSFDTEGPYLKGTITRECGGSVADVVAGRGFGMEFTGGEDDPFPLNKRPIG